MPEIESEIREGVALLRLNRPDKLNAFNRAMALSLQEHLDDAGQSAGIRCVLLTGNGKGFSAGQDLAELTGSDPPSMQQILSEHYNPIIRKIRQLPKPVLAAVNGVAAGAGANIALCCDLVLASETASFIQAFSAIGLIPDSGGTFFLPRLVGWQRASALAITGERVSAKEAQQMGMIYKVLPETNFLDEAMALATRIAAMPTRGLALTKFALNQSLYSNLDDQLALEDKFQQEAALTSDYREGVDAFLNKRKPRFTGQ